MTQQIDHSGLRFVTDQVHGAWHNTETGEFVERPEQPFHAGMWIEAMPLEIKEANRPTLTVYRGEYLVTLPGLRRVKMTRAQYESKYGPQPLSPYWQQQVDAAALPATERSR